MGMTIEEAIEHGEGSLDIFFVGEHREFIETSIDTMRKYQKIERIVNTWHYDITPDNYRYMSEIDKVMVETEVDGGNDK